MKGASASPPNSAELAIPSTSRTPSFNSAKSGKKDEPVSTVTRDVALKIIPKKKVKGNEASVWGEMEVLKGLDHPNVVRELV